MLFNTVQKFQSQNKELSEENQALFKVVRELELDLEYANMREKKILYLVHLMKAKGYPV